MFSLAQKVLQQLGVVAVQQVDLEGIPDAKVVSWQNSSLGRLPNEVLKVILSYLENIAGVGFVYTCGFSQHFVRNERKSYVCNTLNVVAYYGPRVPASKEKEEILRCAQGAFKGLPLLAPCLIVNFFWEGCDQYSSKSYQKLLAESVFEAKRRKFSTYRLVLSRVVREQMREGVSQKEHFLVDAIEKMFRIREDRLITVQFFERDELSVDRNQNLDFYLRCNQGAVAITVDLNQSILENSLLPIHQPPKPVDADHPKRPTFLSNIISIFGEYWRLFVDWLLRAIS